MKFSDLVRDFAANKLSHSKLWANVAYAAVTWVLIYKVLKGTASDDLILFYLGIVALHSTGSKYVGTLGVKE